MSRRKDNPSRWRVWPKEKKTRKPVAKRDTEELVRCKECCHLEITGCYGECGRGYLGIVRPDDYCSRGRRREKAPDNLASGSGRAGDRRGLAG